MNTAFLRPSARTLIAASMGSSLLILLGRTRNSLPRLPSDPGYSYIADAAMSGLLSLVEGDPYFHVAARFLAWLTSWFPLSTQALVLASLVHLVWAGCATAIALVVKLESKSTSMAVLAGMLLVTAPHASESSIGNVGNVKWPLLTSLLVICSSDRAVRHFRGLSITMMVLVGLSNPLTVLCVVPLAALSYRTRAISARAVQLGGLCLLMFIIQVIQVGGSAVLSGQSARVARPWDGMGTFWWSGWLGPVIVSFFIIVLHLLVVEFVGVFSRFESLLAITAFVAAIASYLMGGIGDRYFVLPMTISLIALLVTIRELRTPNQLKRVVFGLALIAIVVPTTKWFNAGWYMTGGPTWHSEVERANTMCNTQSFPTVQLALSPDGSVELPCEYVLRG